jgi:hypothetical protein
MQVWRASPSLSRAAILDLAILEYRSPFLRRERGPSCAGTR